MSSILSYLRELLGFISQWVDFIFVNVAPYWREIIVAVVLIWVFLKAIDFLIAWTSVDHITATVTHKERVYYPKWFYSIYLVYTDQEVLCVQDTWAFLRFGASDRYSKIQVGSTYKFTVCGYRSRWSSSYRNVLRATN